MHGLGMRGDVTSDIRPMIKQFYTPALYSKLVQDGEVLVVGVGGIGCLWAVEAHSGCPNLAELLLIDADESSFEGASDANCLFLDSGGEGRGATLFLQWRFTGSGMAWNQSPIFSIGQRS